MALCDFETKKIEKRRPPPHIRAELDLGFRVKGQGVEVFEIRPRWRNPDEKIEHAVARASYVKTQSIWKIYWQRADLKWHSYEPNPEVGSLQEFLATVDRDDYAAFFGWLDVHIVFWPEQKSIRA